MLGVLEELVAIYSMPFHERQVAECAQIIQMEQRLIIDVDDYLKGMLGREDILQAEKLTPEIVEMHEALLQKATLVTASTTFIADEFRKRLGVECIVCPNGLDIDRFNIVYLNREQRRRTGKQMGGSIPSLKPRRDDMIVVGWSGAAGHVNAFKTIIAPAMNRVLAARDDVLFCVIGNPDGGDSNPIEFFDEAVRGRVYVEPWAALHKHAAVLAQFHISLAPAIDGDEMYLSKSPLRFLEAAASRSAVVASDTTYGETIRQGQELMGVEVGLIVENDPDKWADEILKLIADDVRMCEMGVNARAFVEQHHTTEQTKGQWESAINRALEK
jgi:glycosyltransferase involved in cell wall biosynthesis